MAPPGEPPSVVQTTDGPIPNGPVRNEPKPWERAWSTEEMRKHSSNWTLASDAGLLNFLQEFSQQMISKTHEVEKSLDDLVHETKVTSSKVSNTINDFHMLSNMQFVESRVYDEDISQEATAEPKKPEQKTKEQKEAELLSRIKSALHLGLQVVDQAFNRVDIQQESESEEEEEGGRPLEGGILLEPKDPYAHRSLPYIIGSKSFHEDDYVGLSDMLSEEEIEDESISKEYESEHSSEESESDAENMKNKTNLDKITNAIPPTKEQYSDHSSESGSSDLFGDEKPEKDNVSSNGLPEDEDVATVNKKQAPNFADELTAKLRIPTSKQESTHAKRKEHYIDEEASVGSTEKSDNSREASVGAAQEKKPGSIRTNMYKESVDNDDDLFGPSAEEDSLFSKKDGLFSGGGRLFDDQNEEGDLFDTIDTSATSVPKEEDKKLNNEDGKLIEPRSRGRGSTGKVIYPGSVSIFGDATDKVLSLTKSPDSVPTKPSSLEKQKEVPKKTEVKSGSFTTGTGLFDGSEDEDDLFASLPKKPTSISSPRKGSGTNAFKSISLFSDEDQIDGGIFEEIHTTHSSSSVTPSDADPVKKIPIGGVSLFDGLIGDLGAAIKAKKPLADTDSEDEASPGADSKSSRNATKIAEQNDGLKESQSNSTSSSSIFTEELENRDLFAKKDIKQQPKKSSKGSLFDGDSDLFGDDDELFTAKPTVRKQTGLSLYEDQDLFSSSAKKEEKTVEEKETVKVEKKRTATHVSLFDDDDDNDLFSPSIVNQSLDPVPQISDSSGKDIVDKASNEDVPTKETTQDISKTKTRSSTAKSLFEDDDLLFGGPASESPDVDLFSVQSSVTTKEQVSKVKNNKPLPVKPSFTTSKVTPVDKSTPKVAEYLKSSQLSSSPLPATVSPTKKKPVGGVSLFGGIDLFKDEVLEVKQGKSEPLKIDKEEISKPEPVRVEKTVVHETVKSAEELSVNFDKPVDTSNTLSCASKDRVKIQTRRRLPTRRGRQPSLQPPADVVPNATSNAETTTEIKTNLNQIDSSHSSSFFESSETSSKKESTEVLTSPSTEEEDVFVAIDVSQKMISPVEHPNPKDLFSSYSSVKKDKTLGFEDENLFGTVLVSSEDTRQEDITIKKKSVIEIDSETNDIFSDITVSSTKSKKYVFSDTEAVSKKSSSIFDDVDEDIFSTTALPKGIASKPTGIVKAASQDEEGDIFQSPKKESRVTSKSSDSADIFADSNYDIFASMPVREPVKLKSSSKSLFDNDDIDDLFAPVPPKASPPTSKTKERSSKKTHVESNSNSTNIFDDPLLGNHSDAND